MQLEKKLTLINKFINQLRIALLYEVGFTFNSTL